MFEGLTEAVFVINLFSTVAMTGAIWLAQLSLYPLMELVGSHNYTRYEKEHVRRISFLAWTLLILELITSALLLFFRPDFLTEVYAWVGFFLVFIIWSATWFLQYPYHKKLTKGFDEKLHSKLVGTNWIRTLAWSTRTLLMMIIILNFLF